MKPARSLLIVATLTLASHTHAAVYKCVDEDGRTSYTNDPSAAQECSPLRGDLPFSSIAGPPPRPHGTADRLPSPPAAGFPGVSETEQRSRDDNRRRVLEAELEEERQALREAREVLEAEEERVAPEDRNVVRQRADGSTYRSINLKKREQRLQPYRDQVEMHERNIEALEQELSKLR